MGKCSDWEKGRDALNKAHGGAVYSSVEVPALTVHAGSNEDAGNTGRGWPTRLPRPNGRRSPTANCCRAWPVCEGARSCEEVGSFDESSQSPRRTTFSLDANRGWLPQLRPIALASPATPATESPDYTARKIQRHSMPQHVELSAGDWELAVPRSRWVSLSGHCRQLTTVRVRFLLQAWWGQK